MEEFWGEYAMRVNCWLWIRLMTVATFSESIIYSGDKKGATVTVRRMPIVTSVNKTALSELNVYIVNSTLAFR